MDARYRILQVLNVGEAVHTYLAEDVNLPNHQLIVKQLQPANDHPEGLTILRRLFVNEVKTLEELGQKHDQIQKLVASFEEDEEFYLVQEFIYGNPLSEEILLGKYLQEQQVISLLSEILEILLFVHGQGVIHQDIKPTNIIRRESDKKLVLIDFGTIEEIVTTIVGNLEYIPVEQLHGKPQYNSDIYALGIVMIAALIGLPENEVSRLQTQKNLLTGEIIWRNRTTQISRELAKIIDKMVRFDYRKRYQSVAEIMNDLQCFKNHEYEQPKQNHQKLALIMAGIVGCITFSITAWSFQLPKLVNNVHQLYEEGVRNYEGGKYKEAVEYLTQAIETNPQNSLAYNHRGDAFYRLGEYEQAQADSSQAILLNPQDANAYYDRGFAFYKLGKFQEAIADYTEVIKLDSQNSSAYYNRGLARTQIKDNQRAIKDFSQAIAVNINYAEAYYSRGLIRAKQRNKEGAMADFTKAANLLKQKGEKDSYKDVQTELKRLQK